MLFTVCSPQVDTLIYGLSVQPSLKTPWTYHFTFLEVADHLFEGHCEGHGLAVDDQLRQLGSHPDLLPPGCLE